jgi:DNA-directed RNA polymerase specialized sigma24 family protein
MTVSPGELPDPFATHRRTLTGLAYRMTGSIAEAEDIANSASTPGVI